MTQQLSTSYGSLAKGLKPSKAVSKDETRPVLQRAYLKRTEDGREEIHATDSYIAVRVPVHAPDAAEGFIGVEELTKIEKGDEFTAANGTVEIGTVTYQRFETESEFPDIDKIWPEPAKRTLEIGVNAKLLLALAQAVGSDGVKLTIDLDKVSEDGTYLKTIPVAPLGGPAVGEAEGLLMPIRIHRDV